MEGGDLFIKLSKLVTEEIPVTLTPPIGEPPKGFRFLDIWPRHLYQKVSGPAEQVQGLKKQGLELTFNLNKITAAELSALEDVQGKEISYFVPEEWKQVTVPFRDYAHEPLNDPRAAYLQLDFLKQELVALDTQLPIALFFPVKYSDTFNPQTYSLAPGTLVEEKNGLELFTTPLYAHDVGRLFLDTVKDNMQLTIIVVPKEVEETLEWAIEFINLDALAKRYVTASLQELEVNGDEQQPKYTEEYFRNRFHKYIRQFILYTEDDKPLELQATLNKNKIDLS